MASTSSGAPLRADARRNYARILDAARSLFAESGLDVALDAVAKRAAVGPGTLYRHFPTRDALIAAVLEQHLPDVEGQAAKIEAESIDEGTALAHWLAALAVWMRAYDGMPAPLKAAVTNGASPIAPLCEALIRRTDAFLQSAQESGHARLDVRADDLYLGALADAWMWNVQGATAPTDPIVATLMREGWSLTGNGQNHVGT
ncbi:helix-turn-helix domain-containing protein [Microbacterium sp. NPDC079995]|uniref:TetR/AcrR family transcriptional regulator n=1 Tax=unclassified Microbacterium TaxID=2609290 RepID=UPI00344D88F4